MTSLEYTKGFLEFWKLYPKRWNKDLGCYVKRKKWPAFLKWQKLSKEIRAKCLARVHLVKKMEGSPRDCVTWLNNRGWDDIEEDELKKMPMGLPASMIEGLLKEVPSVEVNINNERNRQLNMLKERK